MTAYARYKREVLGSLSGKVLEIGAGYGANFGYLAAGIDWIGLEPDPAACRRLATMAAAHGYHRPVIASVAERIPLPDASVDAVAGTRGFPHPRRRDSRGPQLRPRRAVQRPLRERTGLVLQDIAAEPYLALDEQRLRAQRGW